MGYITGGSVCIGRGYYLNYLSNTFCIQAKKVYYKKCQCSANLQPVY